MKAASSRPGERMEHVKFVIARRANTEYTGLEKEMSEPDVQFCYALNSTRWPGRHGDRRILVLLNFSQW